MSVEMIIRSLTKGRSQQSGPRVRPLARIRRSVPPSRRLAQGIALSGWTALPRGHLTAVEKLKPMVKNHEKIDPQATTSSTNEKAIANSQAEMAKLQKRFDAQEAKVKDAYEKSGAASGRVSFDQWKEMDAKVERLTKQRDQLKSAIDTVALTQTKAQTAIQTDMERKIKEQDADREASERRSHAVPAESVMAENDKLVERSIFDAKIKALEIQLNAVMALASAAAKR